MIHCPTHTNMPKKEIPDQNLSTTNIPFFPPFELVYGLELVIFPPPPLLVLFPHPSVRFGGITTSPAAFWQRQHTSFHPCDSHLLLRSFVQRDNLHVTFTVGTKKTVLKLISQ